MKKSVVFEMYIHIRLQKYTLDLFCIYILENNWFFLLRAYYFKPDFKS